MGWHESLFARFSRPVQERLLALSEPFHFAADETIFEEGAPSLYLYIVKSGRVAIEAHPDDVAAVRAVVRRQRVDARFAVGQR